MSATFFETRTTYFKKELHPLIDQPRTCHFFMLYCIKLLFAKVNRGIAILRKLQYVSPRKALLTIYKSFVRTHFHYGDVIFDHLYYDSFHAKLESYQYKAALAMTGAIKGSSTEKLYQELGIEHLRSRRWFRKLSFLQNN